MNKVLQLEHEIASFVRQENGATVHFKREHQSFASVTIHAFTINASNSEEFLLKTVRARTEEECLEEILEYVKKKSGESPFTVRWSKKGSNKIEDSYFYCHDITDVVKKFFHNKNVSDYTVYEIKLNPIA